MKKLLVMPCLIALMSFTAVKNFESVQSIESTNEVLHFETETFKVYGNCDMCKKRIEASLKGVEGVQKAEWDVKTKMMTVVFNPHVTTIDKIKATIASVGHDTDTLKADNKVYSKLPGCCKYERK